MQKLLNTDSLENWLKRHDAGKTYQYHASCLLTQYFKAHGVTAHVLPTTFITITENGLVAHYSLPDDWNTINKWVPWTYGDALKRLRKIRRRRKPVDEIQCVAAE